MKRTLVFELSYESIFNDNENFVNAMRYKIAESLMHWTTDYDTKSELLDALIDEKTLKEYYNIQNIQEWLDIDGNKVAFNVNSNCYLKEDDKPLEINLEIDKINKEFVYVDAKTGLERAREKF